MNIPGPGNSPARDRKSRPQSSKRVTARKFGGDDSCSWAVFIDTTPMVTGLNRSQVAYYRKVANEKVAK